jgi:hypothetical protein
LICGQRFWRITNKIIKTTSPANICSRVKPRLDADVVAVAAAVVLSDAVGVGVVEISVDAVVGDVVKSVGVGVTVAVGVAVCVGDTVASGVNVIRGTIFKNEGVGVGVGVAVATKTTSIVFFKEGIIVTAEMGLV